MANSGHQRTMFIRVVIADRPIDVFPGFGCVSSHKQRTAKHPMPDRQRKCLVSLMRERKELSCEVERRMAVKCCKVPNPDAIKDRKQCKRVLGWLLKRLCQLDKQTRLFERGLGLGRSIAFGLHQCV